MKLMAHLVAGYPDRETTLEIASALERGGASMLELQMPSSDPAADGPAIQEACSVSLARGFRLEEGFALAAEIRRNTGLPLYIMAYGSQIYSQGIRNFVSRCKEAGCAGVIAPDLTAGRDEGLYRACGEADLDCVPVIPVTATEGRVGEILTYAGKPAWVYVALRAGITGEQTLLSPAAARLLSRLRASGVRTLAGFGISGPAQLRALDGLTDAVVAGSVFVRAAAEAVASGSPPGPAVRDAAAWILSGEGR